MIQIKTLTINNFLSHIDSYIDFDQHQGLTLILGKNADGRYDSNGSGKSTILEAIIYALTGYTLRGVSADEVVNRQVGSGTVIELEFYNNDISYRIIRYRKHPEYQNKLRFFRDEEELTKRTTKDTQELIDQVIGIPRKILESTVFMGEGLSSRFTMLSDTEKKALIESTLSLDYNLEQLKLKARAELKQAEQEQARHQGLIEATQHNLDLLTGTSKISSEELAQLEHELGIATMTIDQLQKAISSNSLMIETLRDSILRRDQLSRDLQRQEKLSSQARAQADNLKSQPNPICTLCHQEIKDQVALDHALGHLQSQIDELDANIRGLQDSINHIPDPEVMKQRLQELKQKNDSWLNQVKTFQNRHNELMASISAGKENLELQAKLDELHTSLEDNEQALKALEKDYNDYQYIYDMFSPKGLINYILSNSISYINQQLRQYTYILIDKEYEIKLLDNKINLIDNLGSTYESLSNGEKRRLDLSIQFALHDYVYQYCQAKIDVLFIDEVLDTLDGTGVDNIFEVLKLKQEACQLKGIYIITHNNDLKDKFDNYILVEKDLEGKSTIKN